MKISSNSLLSHDTSLSYSLKRPVDNIDNDLKLRFVFIHVHSCYIQGNVQADSGYEFYDSNLRNAVSRLESNVSLALGSNCNF